MRHVETTPLRHPLQSTRVRIRAARHGGATVEVEPLRRHRAQKTLRRLQILERRATQPKQRSLENLKHVMSELFLEKPLERIIHLQTLEKDAWSIFELMQLQEALPDSQLLIVEVQPSDQSCQFRFVGPPRPNRLFILQEENHFHGIKEPITFFGKYCDLH